MRSYSWLALCRQHLLSSTAVGRGDRLRKISSFSNRFLHICGYSIGKRPDFRTTEIQLKKRRYIHATGSCNAKERSYYEILGVSENASKEDIKKSFQSLAKKYHPDANENNPSMKRRFQEIREAYETLRNSEKTAQYEKMRIGDFHYGADRTEGFGYGADDPAGFRYGAGNAGRFRYAYQTIFSNSFHKVVSEILEDEINHFASDIQVELVLTFSEASRGCPKHVTFDAYVPCDSCDGRGYPANAKASTCRTCRGVGKVTIPPFTSTCSHCRGLGRMIKEHCMSCRGSGVVEGIKEVKVTIPEGVYSGDKIRVPEAGNSGGGGRQPGDLFINLKVADDPVFSREGADVSVGANISFPQAILGGKVEVPTLSGKTHVNIPKGVQPGQLVVLRGKGLPKHGFLVDHGRLKSPSTVLQNWINNGNKVKFSQVNLISKQLLKSKRYKQALEILQWMENQSNYRITAGHHALMMELIVKVNGLNKGEEYFEQISGSCSKKVASLSLLHGYVKERCVSKAESFMVKLNSSGFLVTPHPYNEMMKLYMAMSEYEKVPLVIAEMKRNKICPNVLSYNLWMGAFGEVFEVTKAEMVYKKMVSDENIEVGWSTLASLANVYIKAGFVDKALLVLKEAEMKLSANGRLGYFFLITLYSSLKNKEGVLRLWKASKTVGGRIPCADYICVISCLVKVGDLVSAEHVFAEWESNCSRYDIRVSNVLLGAYVRSGLMEKAELFHLHTVESGGCPNYKTWEILMEGWVKSQRMDKAIDAMKKGFSVLKLERCDWRPSHSILMAIAEHFEKDGNFEDANHFVKIVHCLGVATLPLYKLFLRMHLNAQRPTLDILKMMEKDKMELDDETSALVAFDS